MVDLSFVCSKNRGVCSAVKKQEDEETRMLPVAVVLARTGAVFIDKTQSHSFELVCIIGILSQNVADM